MGTIIDKLNYLKQTKEKFASNLYTIGQNPENDTVFRKYMDWTNGFSKDVQKSTNIVQNGVSGYANQNGIPTQDNPIEIITNTGKYEKEVVFTEDKNACYNILGHYDENKDVNINDINFNESSYTVHFSGDSEILIPKNSFNIIIDFKYDFFDNSYGEERESVPFKIYIHYQDEGIEDVEIFSSENTQDNNAHFIILNENNPITLRFKNTDTDEPLDFLNFIDFSMKCNEIYPLDFSEQIHELTMVPGGEDFWFNFKERIYYSNQDDLVNYFNKDADYYLSDLIRIHPNKNEYIEGDEEEGDNEINTYTNQIWVKDLESSNTWQTTSLDNGIRISCSELNTDKMPGIFFKVPKINSGYPSLVTKVEVHGDRIPYLWLGEENTAHDKYCCYQDLEVIDDILSVKESGGYFIDDEDIPEKDYMLIGFGCIPGPNATINDYIDYTNITYTASQDVEYIPQTNVYVPYNEEIPHWYAETEKVGKIIFNGSEEGWTCTEVENVHGLYEMSICEDENNQWHIHNEDVGYETYMLCSHFQDAHFDESEADRSDGTCLLNHYDKKFSFFTTKQNTVSEWKTWLNNNNMTVYYPKDGNYWKYITIQGSLLNQLNAILINEGKNIAKEYIDNFNKTYNMIQTLEEQLEQYDGLKERYTKQLDLLGEKPDEWTELENYLDWIDNLYYTAKERYNILPLQGKLTQSYNPIGEDLVPIQTKTNTIAIFPVPINNGISSNSFFTKDGELNNQFSEYWTDIGYSYWVTFNDISECYIEPNLDFNRKAYLWYTFNLEDSNNGISESTPVVPFKIYLHNNLTNEETEVYNSNGKAEGSAYFEIPKSEYYENFDESVSYNLIFKTNNDENLTEIGFKQIDIWYENINEGAPFINIDNIELVAIDSPSKENNEAEKVYDILNKIKISNYFNITNESVASDLIFDDNQYNWIPSEIENTWTTTQLTNGLKLSCTNTTEGIPQNLVYLADPKETYTIGNTLRITANVKVVGDRKPWIGIGKTLSSNFDIFDLSTSESDEETNNLQKVFYDTYISTWNDERLVIILGNTPGPNATENDYIEYTNIIVTPANDSDQIINDYIPFNNQPIDYLYKIQKINKRIFNGTENNWTCEATETAGVYKMSISEDLNDPWDAAYYTYEIAEWNDEVGDYVTRQYQKGSDIYCNHFKHFISREINNDDIFQSGDCIFDGTSFSFYTDQQTTLADWKTWLEENPLIIYFARNEDKYITHHILNEELNQTIDDVNIDYAKNKLSKLTECFLANNYSILEQ